MRTTHRICHDLKFLVRDTHPNIRATIFRQPEKENKHENSMD
ncbi:hypothetical protein [Alysiella crassa]|nr:hypothetical protein [Alysiella crassa]